MLYEGISLKDYEWSKVQVLYEGQESTYSGSEDLWRWGLDYVSNLETVRAKDEVRRIYLWDTEIYNEGIPRGAWPGTQVYLSKAKLGIYNEYLGLYIHYWDRGYYESKWSKCERKYMVMR